MADTNSIDIYQGINPTVFKKVDSSDVSSNPFQTYKLWTFYSGSATSSCLPLIGIYSDLNNLPALDSDVAYNSASNVDGSLRSVTYFSINHLFYKNKFEPYNTFGPTNFIRTPKYLYQTASVLSIPNIRVGEGIKPASFTFTGSSGTILLSSDMYGNVIDTQFNTASIISNTQYYEGFNEYFDASRISYESRNITYQPGVTATGGTSASIGLAAKFNGNGYIKDEISGQYNRNSDYSISFFISGANSFGNNQLILTKATSSITPKYPFRLELSGSNQLIFSVAGSTTFKTQLTSSAVIAGLGTGGATGWRHVVCQKTGSFMQIYINGTLHASASSTLLTMPTGPFTASARIDNDHALCMGGYEVTSTNLQSSLDEIRIYNKALTSAQVVHLATRTEANPTFLQTNKVGNVFSKQGMVVITSPHYIYNNILNAPYTASYRSTLSMYELGVVTKIDAGDFNLSLNPSLTMDDDVTYQTFASSSAFSPYITTIGLYDDYGQLLAIAKLAQPIKKRDDVDMNFFIRLDIDKNILPG
jgi:hypothetical protein